MDKQKVDWISRIAWVLIIIAFAFMFYYYYFDTVNKCTSNPLQYSIDKYKSIYGDNYNIVGSISIIPKESDFDTPRGIIIFFGDNSSR